MRRYTLNYLFWAVLLGGLIGFLVISQTFASERHHRPIQNTYNITNEACMGNAGDTANDQIHADWHTNKFQMGVGLGYRCGDTGAALGVSQRFGDVLMTGSVNRELGSDDNSVAVGVGANFRF